MKNNRFTALRTSRCATTNGVFRLGASLLLTAVTWLNPPLLRAADYYVSPDGSDSNPGTIEKPWRTIGRATKYGYPRQYRQPGDTVWLRGGLYSGNNNAVDLNGSSGAVSGTATAPITIRAYPGETPVIANTTRPYAGLLMKYLSYWRFEGLTFSNCYRAAAFSGVTNFVLTNCVFGWNPDPGTNWSDAFGWSCVLFNESSQSNKVQACTFLNWGCIEPGSPYGQDIGGFLSIGNGAADSADFYNLVERCTFLHSGHDHLAVQSPYCVVRSNLFINDGWMATNAAYYVMNFGEETNHYGLYGNRQVKPGDGDGTPFDMRTVWEWNTMLYTGVPVDDNGAHGIELVPRFGIFRHNTIAFSLASGIFITAMSANCFAVSNAIYHNVIYGNGLAILYGGTGMRSFACGVGMNNSGGNYYARSNYLVNNIIWNNFSKSSPTNVDSACWLYQQMRTNWVGDVPLADPRFVSTNGLGWQYDSNNLPDFSLQTNSPCIDAGTWLAYCVGSGSGTTLTVDNSLYFSDGNRIVEGDEIQLQGQTTRVRVLSNDWANATLYLSDSLTWTNGQGVALAYYGNAPDMGAYEMPVGTAGRASGAGSGAQQPIPPPGVLRVRPSP